MTDSDATPIPGGLFATRWRAAAATHLMWYEADGDYALYHRPSGKTHFVNLASEQLLGTILCSPRDVVTAAAELARLQGLTDADDAFVLQVAGLLQRFEELGLVERA